MSWKERERVKALAASEIGALRKIAETEIALVYPSPYRAAMSSLGYQTMYRVLNDLPNTAAHRAMLPDEDGPVFTIEGERPISEYPMLAFSVAYELEIAGLVSCLDRAKIPALREERGSNYPLIIAGGPLTFSNPAPLAPFCDVIVMGEAEDLAAPMLEAARASGFAVDGFLDALRGIPGFYIPRFHGEVVPPVAKAGPERVPAYSQILTPNTELADMFLIEPSRGCSRGCTYCVMRRSTNGGMRTVAPDDVLRHIPEAAKRVGLVGAAVTDHPRINEIVRGIVDAGRGVGISSLRADRLNDELVGLLAKGGYRTLTVAGDGASERMRRYIERSTEAKHLLKTAEFAVTHQLKTVKIYMMVGIPTETDADIDELVQLSVELAKIHPKIAYGIAPFVAKRNTPLDGQPFAGIDVVEDRLDRLASGLRRAGVAARVEVRATSARWAWVEYMIAQAESHAGLAIMDAQRAGGSFAAYKKAFAARGIQPTGPRARVPSSAEMVALRRQALAKPVA